MTTAVLVSRTSRAEWLRLRTVRTSWWFGAAAAVFFVGLGLLLGFESAADPVELHGEPAWDTARVLMMPGQFVLLALVITAITADYASGGIVPTLQWTPRRGVLFASRAVVVVGTAVVVGVALTAAAALAAFSTAGGALTLTAGDGLDALGTVAFVLATGAAIAAGLGFLLRSTAGAFVSTFLLVLVLPLLLPALGDWMSEVADVLPGAGTIYLLVGEREGMTDSSAAAVLLGWASGALTLGWWRLVRDDANR